MESNSLKYFQRRGQVIYAPASALGGPVVILRISGENLKKFEALTGPFPEPNHFSYRPLKDPDSHHLVDRALVLYFKAPHSFSGEDVLELQFHGIESILEKVSKICRSLGAQPALSGEFSFRAVLNERMSLAEAESLQKAFSIDGIQADFASTLLGVSKELEFKLNERLAASLKSIAAARGRVEAAIDFSEAEAEQAEDLNSAAQFVESALLDLKRLLGAHENFARNIGDFRVAIVGAPNVGKSTLLNILAGADRALVSPVAGTTRDVLDLRVKSPGGLTYRFLDTAGFRAQTADEVERLGIEKGIDWASRAHVLIKVRRANEGAVFLDARLENIPSLELQSFRDSVRASSEQMCFDLRQDAPSIYKEVFQALDGLRKKVSAGPDLGEDLISGRQARLFQSVEEELAQALQSIRGERPLELAGENLKKSEELLRAAQGQGLSDAYIGEIFSQFCLGK